MVNLANPGDPYHNGKGTMLEPKDNDVAVEAPPERRQLMPRLAQAYSHKSLKTDQLPEKDMQRQNAISVVVCHRLMGISEADIADLLNTSLVKIQEILASPAAQQTFELLYKVIVNASADVVQGRIAAHAVGAVDTVVSLMEDTETRSDVRLKAAQDILDRTGTHPDQFFSSTDGSEHSDDELRIVVLDDSGEKERVHVEFNRKK